MDEARLPITTADARVVSRLADALNSLTTKPGPLTALVPLEEQRPTHAPDDRAKAAVQVSRVAPSLPDVARPAPARAGWHIVKAALPAPPVFEGVAESKTRNGEARSRQSIIEDFRGDRELIQRLGVTPEEIQMLSRVSMLGNLTCKLDVLFILRQLRESGRGGRSLATVSPDTLLAPYQKIEPPIPNLGAMVEWIRSAALANLRKRESSRIAPARRVSGQLNFLYSIKTMLSRRRQQSAA
jgi:hypothetical protein